jgi:hypothetical protein
MVHALKESWRVLKDGGRMVDLRPFASGWPLEIVSRGSAQLAGRLDDHKRVTVDDISNTAIAETVQGGWFQNEREDVFDYAYYWDSVEEMIAYVEDDWSDSAVVPTNVMLEARRLVDIAGDPVEVRIRRKMKIAGYRKLKTSK